MVDQSEFAWRMLSRSFMTPESNKSLLAYTPMLHARMFSETPKFRDAHFQPMKTSLVSQLGPSSPTSSDDLFLDGNPQFDRPLFHLDRAWKDEGDEGAQDGVGRLGVLRFLRENLPKEVVLFANGNILAREDIDECLKATGADGVMSAEGNLYDPTIFSDAPAIGEEGREYWRSLDGTIGGWRMDAVFRRYMDIIYKYVLQKSPPERKPLFITSDPQEEMKEEVEEREEGPPKKKQKGEKKERTTSPSLVAMQPHCFKLLRPLVSKTSRYQRCISQV
ncbi:hypothetical protein DID88_006404 [Monilinia fructigena]|uniref:DUS-like FMN-binding domain-containing protein n=1 Tax=Monilinia fructigena TaxID=38457 RepID=A0A395IDP6_9HELO|nr:hypothetical protein DID88_006404 [Monilinia fructigena]